MEARKLAVHMAGRGTRLRAQGRAPGAHRHARVAGSSVPSGETVPPPQHLDRIQRPHERDSLQVVLR